MKRVWMATAVATIFLMTSLSTVAFTKENDAINSTTIENSVQDEFVQVEISDLPDAVSEAVMDAYEDFDIDEAYVNPVKIYKLIIKDDNGQKTVYFDESGKEIEL